MTDQSTLAQLQAANGISLGYHDLAGNYHPTSEQTGRRLLAAMGIAAASDTEVLQSLNAYENTVWRRLVPFVQVAYEGEPIRLVLTAPAESQANLMRWAIEAEGGCVHQGEFKPDELPVLEEHMINGRLLQRFELTLELRLELGYYRLRFEAAPSEMDCSPMRLIVAPRRCYLPPVLESGGRVWGLSIQLYALRSRRNWGMGDFTDLVNVINTMSTMGCASIGLNPLHALYPDTPDHVSPYSPSSRLFLNPLYIDIESMDDFRECPSAYERVHQAGFQNNLEQLRAQPLIDYKVVADVKHLLFKELYTQFRQRHLDALTNRGVEFRKYQQELSPAIRLHAVFETLWAKYNSRSSSSTRSYSWQDWPREFQQADSESVKLFARTHETQIEFYEYLQWQTELQLAKAASFAKDKGLTLGLYRDLAVGCDSVGADVWAQASLFARSTSIGAPPDDFSPTGQDWGITPTISYRMTETGYQSFIDVLRRNMRHAGALRIDHITVLRRLFWIPDQVRMAGTYVNYPMDDLLGIVALESHRHHCLIIGEDLGTVPDNFRLALDERGVFSYKVFYFEKHWHGDHSYRQPHEYPANSLVTVSTHDLPTLAGFWTEADIRLRDNLDLFPDDDSCKWQYEQRNHDRNRLLWTLQQEGLWEDNGMPGTTMLPLGLSEALHGFLARSKSSVMMIQVEDILGVTKQANLPGTTVEYPNWRQKLPRNLEDWLEDPRCVGIINRISAQRECGYEYSANN